MTKESEMNDYDTPRRCPICNKPVTSVHHPFCSSRCAEVDLHRWLSGAYVVPGKPVTDPEALKEEEEGGEN